MKLKNNLNYENSSIKYSSNASNYIDIRSHLERCNHLFKPALSSYINLDEYSMKLFEQSIRYEIFYDLDLIGLVAIYHNSNVGYISNFSLEQSFIGKGFSNDLMLACLDASINKKLESIRLEVFKENTRAVKFYAKHGFIVEKENNKVFILVKIL
tara:strand:+ start:6253 stop:6717 length:465 start_codon:yes stop_codon:yes gene_type:complete